MDKGQSLRKRKRAKEESIEGASTSSFISPEATVVGSGQYDVFLSFRGSDTRKAFTDCLYQSLVKAGTVPFWVFRDDNSIPIGEEFGSQILDAIARSKISIPVISENYASSKWCLRELACIMDCKKSTSHVVLPIFYKVAPSDVRHLIGNFGNAFHSSKERFDEIDIREGQRALNEVSYLNGWESEKIADGFEMHDQLRDLGRSIFCQGQPLEKRCGPSSFFYKGVSRVLNDQSFFGFDDIWMRAASSGDFNELLSEVIWLHWCAVGSNLDLWPTNLHLPKLMVLDLSDSEIAVGWGGWSSIMSAEWLRVLNLAFCCDLRCTPDLSAFTQLKILTLRGCHELEHLHPSIGKLRSLVSLDLSDCDSLKELPEELGGLKDLEELLLDFASIAEIPTSIGSLRKLETLSAFLCKSLREIPSSIGDLQNLRHLDLSYSGIEKLPSAIGRLKNLRTLRLRSCRILKGAIPSEIGDLSSLEVLDIAYAPIFGLPKSIQNLSSLQRLDLSGCKSMEALPDLTGCEKLRSLIVQNCKKLTQLQGLEKLDLVDLDISDCDTLGAIPKLLGTRIFRNYETWRFPYRGR